MSTSVGLRIESQKSESDGNPVQPKRLSLARIPGFTQAIPLLLGYTPVAFAFGLVASEAGLTLWTTFLMSFFVYAGCSQFIAVSMLVSGAPIAAVVLTTFVVNLRHLLLSMAIAPFLCKWSRAKRVLFGLQMTDEIFMLQTTEFQRRPPDAPSIFGVNLLAHAAWITGSVLGFLFASRVGSLASYGFDFALPAMFICLLSLQLVSRVMAAVAAAGVVCLVVFKLSGFGTWSPIAATFAAASLGVWIQSCKKTA